MIEVQLISVFMFGLSILVASWYSHRMSDKWCIFWGGVMLFTPISFALATAWRVFS